LYQLERVKIVDNSRIIYGRGWRLMYWFGGGAARYGGGDFCFLGWKRGVILGDEKTKAWDCNEWLHFTNKELGHPRHLTRYWKVVLFGCEA
jgi:hypothetical protein